MTKFKGFRTIAINGAVFVVMLGAALSGQITDPDILRGIVMATAVANVVIRFFTDTSVGKSN